jgi:hypothetical protein
MLNKRQSIKIKTKSETLTQQLSLPPEETGDYPVAPTIKKIRYSEI